ncbi:alpha/beta fold hydrolase [Pseudomonas sp. N040]|uniref:alpha/beta fold hydrolase n=1 Tax=Pseudomonas sp. N040 TaxID=2785325 RepID=UPI0018A25F43|nr:alpha/beta fold hydrolase [Pseudomonas sp. N040]MBF7731048.1 alpha/beta fold hydrolase [Pseudomonas sp. N040]MBW7014691.1 alpha/beta fold hydrolase [Pseudomonas sp. N040]
MKTVTRWFAGVLLLVLLALGGLLALSWAPDLPLAELKARWAPAPSTFIEVQGMSVHVRDEGPRDDPTPLLLLHGTSSSLHTWEGWAAALKATHRVIRVDLPGFGLTGPFPDGDYRMAHYSAFIAGLLDALQVERVVLAGNSLGGQIAWETALAWPQRVSRLILVDAAGFPMQSTSVPIGFRIARIPELAPLVGKILPRSMIESSVRNVYGDPERVTAQLVERYYQLTLRPGNRQALVQRFSQRDDPRLNQPRISRLGLPTLIIWGGRDGLIPPEHAALFQAAIKGSEVSMFETLGHVPQEEDAAATVAVVEAFLGR